MSEPTNYIINAHTVELVSRRNVLRGIIRRYEKEINSIGKAIKHRARTGKDLEASREMDK